MGAVAAAVLVLYSGCGDQSSERRGGADVPDLSAGSGMIGALMAGASGDASEAAGASGAAGSELVSWCSAYAIINCVCQQCHQNPPLHNAPIPLLDYADTQAQFGPSPDNRVWQTMQDELKNRFMPYTGSDPVNPVVPPVKPLSDEQRSTMLTWLAQGALDVGGQGCPMTCDWSKGAPAAAP